jgi:hypothetical protein
MFKVSGATVYPNEVERALRSIDGVDNAFVTNASGAAGERVGAAAGQTRHPSAARNVGRSQLCLTPGAVVYFATRGPSNRQVGQLSRLRGRRQRRRGFLH